MAIGHGYWRFGQAWPSLRLGQYGFQGGLTNAITGGEMLTNDQRLELIQRMFARICDGETDEIALHALKARVVDALDEVIDDMVYEGKF